MYLFNFIAFFIYFNLFTYLKKNKKLSNLSLDLITIGSAIYCNAFFLSWSEQK